MLKIRRRWLNIKRTLGIVLVFVLVFSAFASFSGVQVKAQSNYSVFSFPVSFFTDNEVMKVRLYNTFQDMPEYFTNEDGSSLVFANASECMGYAKWVYNHLFDSYETGHPNQAGYYGEYSYVNGTLGDTTTASDLKYQLDSVGARLGSMLYCYPEYGCSGNHTMVLLKYDSEGMYLLHANWEDYCKVSLTYMTLQEFCNKFTRLGLIRVPWCTPGDEYAPTKYMELRGKSTVYMGSKYIFQSKQEPDNVFVPGVDWKVENITGLASVSDKGVLSAVKPGLVTLSVTAKDGTFVSAYKTVRIAKRTEVINLRADALNENTAYLKWDNCPLADGYLIYRSDSVNGEYRLIGHNIGRFENSFTDEIEYGKDYYYKVCIFITDTGNGESYIGEKCTYTHVKVTEHTNDFIELSEK